MKKYYIICNDVESAWKRVCLVFPTQIMINNKYCLDFTDKQFILIDFDSEDLLRGYSGYYVCRNSPNDPYSERNIDKMIYWIRNMIKDRINEAEEKALVVKTKWISWILPEIKKVIYNDPATIIIWEDGTKTVVKAEGEDYDPEKGLAMAIAKKAFGNEGNYYNEFKKWLPKEN
jgi:hypothetical protein